MKISNKELLGISAALGALRAQKMQTKLAWKLVTAGTAIAPFTKVFDEQMLEIRERWAEKDDKGKAISNTLDNGQTSYKIPDADFKNANADLEELLEQTFVVENVGLKLSDFPDSLEVTPEILDLLAPLIQIGA